MIPEKVMDEYRACRDKYEINTRLRQAHFLAQCSHESAGFTRKEENLNYSAERLLRVFPKYFTPSQAAEYANDSVAIGSRVYANRMGNGSEASGEGYVYRGRGYIQLTGKNNYKDFDKVVDADVVNFPIWVKSDLAMESAAWFWQTREINNIADCGLDEITVQRVTKAVNGGHNGLAERYALTVKLYEWLKDEE